MSNVANLILRWEFIKEVLIKKKHALVKKKRKENLNQENKKETNQQVKPQTDSYP